MMIKVQTLLNSPWGVSGLVIAATATIYLNVVQPIQANSYSDSTYNENNFDDTLITGLNTDRLEINTAPVNQQNSVDLNALVWRRQPARDPFRATPHTQTTIRSAPVLSAIIAGSEIKLAVLDGEIVETGNKVGAYTVTRIEQQSVSLSGPYGKTMLSLNRSRK